MHDLYYICFTCDGIKFVMCGETVTFLRCGSLFSTHFYWIVLEDRISVTGQIIVGFWHLNTLWKISGNIGEELGLISLCIVLHGNSIFLER